MHSHALCIRKETPFKNLITDGTLLVDKTVVVKCQRNYKEKGFFKILARRCIRSGVSKLTHIRRKDGATEKRSVVNWNTQIIKYVLVAKTKLPNGPASVSRGNS